MAIVSSACVKWSPVALGPAAPGSCRSAAVRWLAPDDPRERARLDAWCAGVGDVAIHAAPATNAPDAIGIEDITFVSWNVHVGGGDVRAFIKDLTNGTHTDGRAVRHYVLLLQEAVCTEGVPPLRGAASGASRIRPRTPAAPIDIVQISRELGLSLVYVPSMRNGASRDGPSEDRGNAILSTEPLSDLAVALGKGCEPGSKIDPQGGRIGRRKMPVCHQHLLPGAGIPIEPIEPFDSQLISASAEGREDIPDIGPHADAPSRVVPGERVASERPGKSNLLLAELGQSREGHQRSGDGLVQGLLADLRR
jgi:hypothetical protein